jgi:hypothetical protein
MPLIKIDLSKMKGAMIAIAAGPNDVDRLLRGVSAVVHQRWVSLAQQNLRTTARDYVAGIQPVEVKNRVARVVLVGVVPNLVENGMSAFDLRTTLLGLGARNARTAKDGSRYNTIPFGHGTPGSGGRNVGRPMPQAIHTIAKKLAPTLSKPEGGTQWGGRIHPGMRMSSAARAILSTKEKPWHWGSTYLGMVRQQKTYAKATQNKYTTFRRISSNVRRAKEHWLHPGIRARNFAQRVQREVEPIVKALLATTTAPKGSKTR